jgi:hypothetical protein
MLLAVALAVAGCTVDEERPQRDVAAPSVRPLTPLDPTVSMTTDGAKLYASSEPQELPRPRYDVEATVEPATGRVVGEMTAAIPVGDLEQATFRFFAGLPELDAAARIDRVDVDGAEVDPVLDASILTVPLPETPTERVTVRIRFRYALPETERPGPAGLLSGGELTAAEIGLLARHPDAMSLGHWLPLWVPPGRSAEPVPDGFGDIGAFAAADITATLDVPSGWSVVDSGVRTGQEQQGDRTVVTSEGAGMRDFSVAVVRDHETRTRELDGELAGVSVSATAPAAGADQLESVLDETEVALRELSAAFGGYPWREFDVVSAPLAGPVGGMEWPGATWIEAGLFNGGIPGLGDLSSVLDDLDVDETDLSGLLEELGGGADLDELTLLLESTRAWTIAHEVAHSWWTVVVGNDSVEDPVVDEPLAQYGSCLVVRASLSQGEAVCRSQIGSGYDQMRLLDEEDGPADRATDAFESSVQYGGLVYGKAAAFYLALEERYGVDRVTSALRTLVGTGAFRMLTGDDVAAALARRLGPEARTLWTRWMHEAHGDSDLGAPARS